MLCLHLRRNCCSTMGFVINGCLNRCASTIHDSKVLEFKVRLQTRKLVTPRRTIEGRYQRRGGNDISLSSARSTEDTMQRAVVDAAAAIGAWPCRSDRRRWTMWAGSEIQQNGRESEDLFSKSELGADGSFRLARLGRLSSRHDVHRAPLAAVITGSPSCNSRISNPCHVLSQTQSARRV
jgi:hypothetical protein